MDRSSLVDLCFQHGKPLTLDNPVYRRCVDDLLRWLLDNDGADNDCTVQTLDLRGNVTAIVETRQSGVIAGIDEALYLLGKYPVITVQQHIDDGSSVDSGIPILTFTLDIGALLSLERTILNIIGRMSGIATQTHHLAALSRSLNGPAIAGTRKTPWMLLDKRGVYRGGGLTHRLSLSDAILIKDNHLAAFGRQIGSTSSEQTVRKTVETVVAASPSYFELEVEGIGQANAALDAYRAALSQRSDAPPMVVMLDNFKPPAAKEFIDKLRSDPVYERVLFEASGDITEETLSAWATTGVDVASLGALTHSIKNFNISMTLTA